MATDWRTDLVDRIRGLIVEAEPDVVEEAFVQLVREAVAFNRA
ncbi:MAG: hypothetical protein ABIR57_00795 [Aeromicrobium sp.]